MGTKLNVEQIEKELSDLFSKIDKQYGAGSAYLYGSREPDKDVDAISTGSLSLDKALGIGGIPRGRVTEIYGPEAVGKSTLAQHIAAEAQRQGLIAAYIDMEHCLEPKYAQACGVDIDNLFLSQPNNAEEALGIMRQVITSHKIGVVIIDSVAALVPRAELEGEVGDSHPGLQARLMSRVLRMSAGEIRRSNTAVVFVNQIRMKIQAWGNPETTSGGRALKFYASVRLDMRYKDSIKQGGEIIGNEVKVRVTKNKVASPFKLGVFSIIYGKGISQEDELLDWGAEFDVYEKRGSYYYLEDEDNYVQGRASAVKYLEENPELADKLREEIEKHLSKEEIEDD